MISNWSCDWSHYSILVFFHRKVQHYYGYLDYEIDFKIIEKKIHRRRHLYEIETFDSKLLSQGGPDKLIWNNEIGNAQNLTF